MPSKMNICMKKIVLLLFVCACTICTFAQSDELRKITKYVIATSEKSYLYQAPKFNSPRLALVPTIEDEEGNVLDSEIKWINPTTKEEQELLLSTSVLPVIYETGDWYFVYYTVSSSSMKESKTAFVPKENYIESSLVDISEQVLARATGLNVSIRNNGKYKGYMVLWGHDEYEDVLVLGQMIDHMAFVFDYKPYIIDDDQQVILCDDYEGDDSSLNLGKKYLSVNKGNVDFKLLTDEDMDRISPWYNKAYTSMYVQVEKAQDACLINLDDLAGVNVVSEESPEFIGGEEALLRWINQNVKYPQIAKDNHVTGKVMVSFVVDVDGTINDVKVVRPVDPALDKEAIRVVKSMPKWKPGKRNGVPVPVSYSTVIGFIIQ